MIDVIQARHYVKKMSIIGHVCVRKPTDKGWGIFNKNFSLETYNSFYEYFKGDKTSLEKTINHIHLRYINMNVTPSDNVIDQYIYLGNLLKQMWQCKLDNDFPEREMIVNFCTGSKEDLDGFEVSFWTKRFQLGLAT